MGFLRNQGEAPFRYHCAGTACPELGEPGPAPQGLGFVEGVMNVNRGHLGGHLEGMGGPVS